MNDPEIHSSTWEWDMSGGVQALAFTHNFMHHKYTNILGMDAMWARPAATSTVRQVEPLQLGNLFYTP